MLRSKPFTKPPFEDAQLRIGNILLVERPKKEGIFILQFDPKHGRFLQ
jgi:hypothetical protein